MRKLVFGMMALAGLGVASAHAADKVTLQLKWVTQAQFAGYYVAKDKGFYKDQCLDVTILEGGVDIVPQTQLAQGNADFAIAWVPKALAEREAGAQVTDIVVLMVAADDGVMPQTIEAISHARAAEVPIVVAINKIDKENADVQRVYAQLAEQNLVPESWGGDTICVEMSAQQNLGIDDLLEQLNVVAEGVETEQQLAFLREAECEEV